MVQADAGKQPTKKHQALKRTSWAVSGIAAVAIAATAVQLNATVAQAKETLNQLAAIPMTYAAQDQPDSGEYLKISHHTWGDQCTFNLVTSEESCDSEARNSGILYVPGDPSREWVLVNENEKYPLSNGYSRAKDGNFDGMPRPNYQDLFDNASSGEALYMYVDETYSGSSGSRAESNFVRLTDALQSGFVPADKRPAFYEALTHVSGVSVEQGVETHDGEIGIAIGRTELLRHGIRQEIIVSSETGDVIGGRSFSTTSFAGFGKNEMVSTSVIESEVVISAP
ncbi:hypothetical protein [Glutamicibacter arilaitensis]|uniref:hypothetical protein n=1 Tax=Glutamicibacter arilaitensis TaxID=256701 RepID=UPI00384CB86B